MAIYIDEKRCPANHRCPSIKVCPFEAISQDGNGLPKVDEEKCTECGKCMKFCPMRAIKKEDR